MQRRVFTAPCKTGTSSGLYCWENKKAVCAVETSVCDYQTTLRRSPRDAVRMIKATNAICSEILFTELSCVLECDAVWFCKGLSTFRGKIL